ncbi:MAG: prepilin-type N-terminal cleavage/methylation domain-containing protein [Pirellulaceae bacterium]
MRTPKSPRRCGLSLLELLVVVSLLGIFSATALMRFGRDIFGDTGARSAARVLSLSMLHAQRAAIRTGNLHAVRLVSSDGKVSGWTVVEELPDTTQRIVDGPFTVAENITVKADGNEMWFDFEGNGNTSFSASIVGPNRAYSLTVEPLTQMIRTQEISK